MTSRRAHRHAPPAARPWRVVAAALVASLVSASRPSHAQHRPHRPTAWLGRTAALGDAPGEDPTACLATAATHARPGARRVLETARAMVSHHVGVRGTCYTWANAVYHRAGGHPDDVFRSTHRAPYVDAAMIRPGDWLFFINHSYRNATHSAIFVRWIDPSRRTGLVVSHPGGHRWSHGRLGRYDLSHVYRLVRMGDDPRGAPHNP